MAKTKDTGFISFSNEEIKAMPLYAQDLANSKGYFRIEHTNEDGTTEICRVTSSVSPEGYRMWVLGAYTTKADKTYLAVSAGKVLPHIKIVKRKGSKK
jgi:hypothetical protein